MLKRTSSDDFCHQLLVGGLLHSFYFQRVLKTGGVRYYVSVADSNTRQHHFETAETFEGKWKIIDAPKVPDWIHSLEEELGKAILSNELK